MARQPKIKAEKPQPKAKAPQADKSTLSYQQSLEYARVTGCPTIYDAIESNSVGIIAFLQHKRAEKAADTTTNRKVRGEDVVVLRLGILCCMYHTGASYYNPRFLWDEYNRLGFRGKNMGDLTDEATDRTTFFKDLNKTAQEFFCITDPHPKFCTLHFYDLWVIRAQLYARVDFLAEMLCARNGSITPAHLRESLDTVVDLAYMFHFHLDVIKINNNLTHPTRNAQHLLHLKSVAFAAFWSQFTAVNSPFLLVELTNLRSVLDKDTIDKAIQLYELHVGTATAADASAFLDDKRLRLEEHRDLTLLNAHANRQHPQLPAAPVAMPAAAAVVVLRLIMDDPDSEDESSTGMDSDQQAGDHRADLGLGMPYEVAVRTDYNDLVEDYLDASHSALSMVDDNQSCSGLAGEGPAGSSCTTPATAAALGSGATVPEPTPEVAGKGGLLRRQSTLHEYVKEMEYMLDAPEAYSSESAHPSSSEDRTGGASGSGAAKVDCDGELWRGLGNYLDDVLGAYSECADFSLCL